jgi:hypothetical protein
MSRALSERDIERLIDHCREVLDLEDDAAASEYGYCSVPLCIIDAVYSINARYSSVQHTVARYCSFYGLPQWIKEEPHPPPPERQERVSDFVQKIEAAGVEQFVGKVLCNRQRTSTRSGILKAEAVLLFGKALQRGGVEYLQDVPRAAKVGLAEAGVLRIPGQHSGLSWRYFLMLTGFEDLVKPDRMILGFLSRCLGRTAGADEAQELLRAVCAELRPDYPHLTPRLLDNRVWAYQRGLDK